MTNTLRQTTPMSIVMVRLASILPNPYRHIENYKLSESKIESLIQSYSNSEFWHGSIQARLSPRYVNKYEIAFGHHRIEAARRASIHEVGLVVADRSNEDMLRMMADENREEFRADALVGLETIRAVVEAYAKGEIVLKPVDPSTNKTQIYALPGGKAYTLSTIASFLNWVKPSDGQATRACRLAFDAFREQASTAEALASIPSADRSERAIEAVTTAARAARVEAQKAHLTPAKVRQAEKTAAAHAAKEVLESTGQRARTVAVAIGRGAVKQITEKRPATVPTVEIYIERIIRDSEKIDPYADLIRTCTRLLPHLGDLNPQLRKRLATALGAMLTRTSVRVERMIRALHANDVHKLQRLLGE